MYTYFKENPIDKEDKLPGETFCLVEEDDIVKNVYLISNKGRFFNMKTKRELIKQKRCDGIYYVQAQKLNKKKKNLNIHTLVAKYHLPRYEEDKIFNKRYVMFRDGNKTNVDVSNLKWVTYSELRYNKKNVKLSNRLVHRICYLLEEGIYSVRDIELMYRHEGITYNMIYNIATKKTWTEISDEYDLSNITKKPGVKAS